MRKTLLHIFLFIIVCRFPAQNYIDYYNLANEAEHQFVERELGTAQNIFTGLEKQFNGLKPKDNFYAGIIHYFNGNTANGFKYLAKSVAGGFRVSEHIQKARTTFTGLPVSEKAIEKISFLENKIPEQVHKTILDTLKYFKRISDKIYQTRESYNAGLDSLLQVQFLAYIQKNGVPNLYTYGDWQIAVMAYHVAADPVDSAVYENYRIFYFDEIVKGNIVPYYYCILIDGHLARDQKTFYGVSPAKFAEKLSKHELLNNRKGIGLSAYYEGPCLQPRFMRLPE